MEGETRFAFPPSNGRFAPCLPFSGGAWTRALRPKGHTPLDSPRRAVPRGKPRGIFPLVNPEAKGPSSSPLGQLGDNLRPVVHRDEEEALVRHRVVAGGAGDSSDLDSRLAPRVLAIPGGAVYNTPVMRPLHQSGIALCLSAALLFSSCGSAKKPRVIVLGFDGLDPTIVDTLIKQGKLPNLARLREQGAWGSLQSIRPSISAVIWTSIATGTTMIKHGIVSWTYIREKGISVPYNQSEVRQPPVWEILDQWKKRSVVVNWFNTYPPEPIRGVIVSDMARRFIQLKKPSLLRDTVYPPSTFSLVERFADRDLPRVLRQNELPNYFMLARQLGMDIQKTPFCPITAPTCFTRT